MPRPKGSPAGPYGKAAGPKAAEPKAAEPKAAQPKAAGPSLAEAWAWHEHNMGSAANPG